MIAKMFSVSGDTVTKSFWTLLRARPQTAIIAMLVMPRPLFQLLDPPVAAADRRTRRLAQAAVETKASVCGGSVRAGLAGRPAPPSTAGATASLTHSLTHSETDCLCIRHCQ